jgi:hypothetical protein
VAYALEGKMMARNLTAKKDTKSKGRTVGIPGDVYRVQVKGNQYFVVNADTRMTVAGPYKSRDAAQQRADQLERTKGR